MKRKIAFIGALLSAFATGGDIVSAASPIPADRLPPSGLWKAAGVKNRPEARMNLIDVTLPPFNADKTGTNAADEAINAAIASAKFGDVVYLPSGRYRIEKQVKINKNNITLRGDGDSTVLVGYGNLGRLDVGISSSWGQPISVTAAADAGDTALELSDVKGLKIGDMIRISMLNDIQLPQVHVFGTERVNSQTVRIVDLEQGQISIDPPLSFDLDPLRMPEINRNSNYRTGIGIESLKIDGRSRTGVYAIYLNCVMDCWVTNVTSVLSYGYHFYLNYGLQNEFRSCWIEDSHAHGPNNSGIKLDSAWSTLIENNVLVRLFPAIQINGQPASAGAGGGGSGGNVIAYNFAFNSYADSGLAGPTYESSHGPHVIYDLYEGNIGEKFQMDGYFGSGSHVTAIRNWFEGIGPENNKNFRCIDLCRFTRYYNIVGNILGKPGADFVYDAGETPNLRYETSFIYRLGYPNVDNGVISGWVEPSAGVDWAEFGENVGASGYQQFDRDVRNTTLIEGNWNSVHNSVPAAESYSADSVLPPSLYLDQKPAWFEELVWPPFDSENPVFAYSRIPAGLRFLEQRGIEARPAPPENFRRVE